MTGDIVSRIDALIDEQLAAGEPRVGYHYGDPTFPDCAHCGRKWHGLALTHAIEHMHWTGVYDEGYRYADDDSQVLCPGSEFIGPMLDGVAQRTFEWADLMPTPGWYHAMATVYLGGGGGGGGSTISGRGGSSEYIQRDELLHFVRARERDFYEQSIAELREFQERYVRLMHEALTSDLMRFTDRAIISQLQVSLVSGAVDAETEPLIDEGPIDDE